MEAFQFGLDGLTLTHKDRSIPNLDEPSITVPFEGILGSLLTLSSDQSAALKVHLDVTKIVSLSAYRAAREQCEMRSVPHSGHEKLVFDRRIHPRQGEQDSDRRNEPRCSLEGRCAPTAMIGNCMVGLANVSRNGLMIKADLKSMTGTRILVTPAGGPTVSARLIWKRNGLAGLEAPMASSALHAI